VIAAPAMKRIARFALHRLGGLRPLIWTSRERFRILTYHRFSVPGLPGAMETLDRQCAFLRRHFQPVPLAEIARSLDTGAPLPPGAVAVTVDDGYRDFLLDAFPVFEKWRIPATVFLMTDFIDRKTWPWWSQVEYAVRHGRARRVRLCFPPNLPERELPLESREQRQRAEAVIREQLVKIPGRERLAFMESLAGIFDLEIPREAPPEHAALTWDDVRRLTGAGVEFGAHTKTHPILPLEDEASIEEEIAGSKARIEEEVGQPALHFCYPNGDYNDAAIAAVARCGFQTAVTIHSGLNAPRANRYLLKRLSIDFDSTDAYFREHVAGMHV
jgi:peptidoglycan/xylan/chitin deacetylase (PgdA/CDA1 family)